MQYIDNDMDELFRKAGENYPLRTDGADWDALQAKLADSTSDAAIDTPRKFNRNYLWLLLLLFVPLIMVVYKSDNKNLAGTGTSRDHSVTGNSITNTNRQSISEKKIIENKPLAIRNDSDGNRPQKTKLMDSPVLHAESPFSPFEKRGSGVEHDNSRVGDLSRSKMFLQMNTPRRRSGGGKPNPPFSKGENATDVSFQKAGKAPTLLPENIDITSTPRSSNKESIPVDSTTAIRQPKQKDSVSIDKQDSAVVQKKPLIKPKDNKKGFYFGIIGGPDISSIKAQKVTKAGYSVGAVLGYSINKHWSVEAGALWDQKKYYTKGEYFDKTGTSIPQSVTVHYLDGSCNMFEFPIAIRYDLNMKKNSFFVTAGITSYLMKKESYTYGADNNGNYYEGFKTYKNSGNNLFSNLQMSAGYNYNLSPKLSLRIEPYIKVPVRDIGIGKMPISSKGIYIGITRRIR